MFSGETILKRKTEKTYEILSSLSFTGSRFKVTVQYKDKLSSGLITDGCSVPRFLWWFIGCPFVGKYVGSAILHDALYASHILSRKEADILFLEMLNDNGVGWVKRKLMYYGVRYFASSAYAEKSQQLINHARQFVTVGNVTNKGTVA